MACRYIIFDSLFFCICNTKYDTNSEQLLFDKIGFVTFSITLTICFAMCVWIFIMIQAN